MPDALVTDLLPAGLEIENFNLGDAKQWAGVVVDGIEIADRDEAAEVRHEEYRDDRYVAALKLDTARHRAAVLPGARGHAGNVHGAAVAGRGHVPPGPARRRQGQSGDVDGEAAGAGQMIAAAVPRELRHCGGSCSGIHLNFVVWPFLWTSERNRARSFSRAPCVQPWSRHGIERIWPAGAAGRAAARHRGDAARPRISAAAARARDAGAVVVAPRRHAAARIRRSRRHLALSGRARAGLAAVPAGLLNYEDRWFWRHRGINPSRCCAPAGSGCAAAAWCRAARR